MAIEQIHLLIHARMEVYQVYRNNLDIYIIYTLIHRYTELSHGDSVVIHWETYLIMDDLHARGADLRWDLTTRNSTQGKQHQVRNRYVTGEHGVSNINIGRLIYWISHANSSEHEWTVVNINLNQSVPILWNTKRLLRGHRRAPTASIFSENLPRVHPSLWVEEWFHHWRPPGDNEISAFGD